MLGGTLVNEAKYELKRWTKWKRMIQLLEETRDQLYDMNKAIDYDPKIGLPGTGHDITHEKMLKLISECDQYNLIISEYEFLVNRLEKGITELLTKEQRQVCIIYANHPNNSSAREMAALEHGFSRATYYRLLGESFEILTAFLEPCTTDTKLILK